MYIRNSHQASHHSINQLHSCVRTSCCISAILPASHHSISRLHSSRRDQLHYIRALATRFLNTQSADCIQVAGLVVVYQKCHQVSHHSISQLHSSGRTSCCISALTQASHHSISRLHSSDKTSCSISELPLGLPPLNQLVCIQVAGIVVLYQHYHQLPTTQSADSIQVAGLVVLYHHNH